MTNQTLLETVLAERYGRPGQTYDEVIADHLAELGRTHREVARQAAEAERKRRAELDAAIAAAAELAEAERAAQRELRAAKKAKYEAEAAARRAIREAGRVSASEAKRIERELAKPADPLSLITKALDSGADLDAALAAITRRNN